MTRWVFAFASMLLLILPLTTTGCSKSNTIEGVVDHKQMEGVKGGMQCSFLLSRTGDDGTPENSVYDDDFRACFPVRGELVVSEQIENQLKAVYSDFVYHVSVRRSPGDTLDYLTTREIFNEMNPGATVKLRVSTSSGVPRTLKIID